jgi:hypothetical protein
MWPLCTSATPPVMMHAAGLAGLPAGECPWLPLRLLLPALLLPALLLPSLLPLLPAGACHGGCREVVGHQVTELVSILQVGRNGGGGGCFGRSRQGANDIGIRTLLLNQQQLQGSVASYGVLSTTVNTGRT